MSHIADLVINADVNVRSWTQVKIFFTAVPLFYPCKPPSSAAQQLSWLGRCWPCCCWRYRPSWCSCDAKQRHKGGHTESMNITLHPASSSSSSPPGDVSAPLGAAILCHNLFFFLFKGPILSGGICFTAAKLHFIWRKSFEGSSWTVSFFIHCSCMVSFTPPPPSHTLREMLLFFTIAGWGRSSECRKH